MASWLEDYLKTFKGTEDMRHLSFSHVHGHVIDIQRLRGLAWQGFQLLRGGQDFLPRNVPWGHLLLLRG